jgi:hypothetical protein
VLLVVESCGLIHRQLTPQGRPFIMRLVIGKPETLPLTNTDYTDPEGDAEEGSETWNVWRRIERFLPA